MDAGDLRPGLSVRQADGDYELVETVELEQRTQRMYNLTVAEAHTFFVGDEAWLVHNACGDDFIEFYHGTSKRGAENIRQNGIDLDFTKPRRDFGKGFYVTTDRNQAAEWAAKNVDGGGVLTFRVPASEVRGLHGYTFRGASQNWTNFVRNNRLGHPIPSRYAKYDFIQGTMLLNPDAFLAGASPLTGGQQTTWYSQRSLDLLMRSLVP